MSSNHRASPARAAAPRIWWRANRYVNLTTILPADFEQNREDYRALNLPLMWSASSPTCEAEMRAALSTFAG